MTVLDDSVEYRILIRYSPEQYVVSEARFVKDFGPWKAGERCSHLEFDFEQGLVSELGIDSVDAQTGAINDDKRYVIKSCRFKIVPLI